MVIDYVNDRVVMVYTVFLFITKHKFDFVEY